MKLSLLLESESKFKVGDLVTDITDVKGKRNAGPDRISFQVFRVTGIEGTQIKLAGFSGFRRGVTPSEQSAEVPEDIMQPADQALCEVLGLPDLRNKGAIGAVLRKHGLEFPWKLALDILEYLKHKFPMHAAWFERQLNAID